jgi:phage portal protein BeeE
VTVDSLLQRIDAARGREVARDEARYSADLWLNDYLLPANQFSYGGNAYPFGLQQTWFNGSRSKEISATLPGYMAALRSCPPAFAAQMVRAAVLSQARFTFRNRSFSATPGRTFGTRELDILERPWPNATTSELLNRMEWHAGLAGNAFVVRQAARLQQPARLRVLRPDWVVIIYGSQQEPDDAAHALDGEIIGYAYCNGGLSEHRNEIHTLLPEDVAHWSPLPDPEFAGIGMSWITPALREIQGDRAATEHKLQFFSNGATPNMVVKGIVAKDKTQFNEIVDAMEEKHAGIRNAYRTLYLAAGADATVVGADLKQLEFKATQGAGETRIAMLSRVHPVILAASEGLQGAALNAGNFASARRAWADSWIYPTLQDLAASLASIVNAPRDAELWPVTTDMPILREDAKDAAEIQQVNAATIGGLIKDGFTAESAVAAVRAQDFSLLKHTGLVSVQLQPPGNQLSGGAPAPAPPVKPGGKP